MPAKPHALMAKLYDEGPKYVSVSGVFGGSEVEQLNILRTTLYVWIRGISKTSNSCVLLRSHAVWMGGMKFSFSMESLAFLHEMEEIKHPL